MPLQLKSADLGEWAGVQPLFIGLGALGASLTLRYEVFPGAFGEEEPATFPAECLISKVYPVKHELKWEISPISH